tara:strand:- start:8708 stop:9061 length:354 start_codon:yes stop_codon:yes gene_type:complete
MKLTIEQIKKLIQEELKETRKGKMSQKDAEDFVKRQSALFDFSPEVEKERVDNLKNQLTGGPSKKRLTKSKVARRKMIEKLQLQETDEAKAMIKALMWVDGELSDDDLIPPAQGGLF